MLQFVMRLFFFKKKKKNFFFFFFFEKEYDPGHKKKVIGTCVNSKDPDQPAKRHNLKDLCYARIYTEVFYSGQW